MEEKIIAMLSEIIGDEEGELEAELDLFEAGLLDSFGVVQLFVELEEQLGIRLEVEALTREEIATPARIARLAEQKQ